MTTMGCKRTGPRKGLKRGGGLLRRSPLRKGKSLRDYSRDKVLSGGLSEFRALVVELDRTHAAVVRASGDGRCVICGTGHITDKGPFVAEQTRIECGHLFSRANMATRWDFGAGGNCHRQCHRCNQQHEADAAPFRDWFVRNFGPAALGVLTERALSVKQWTVSELRARLAVLMDLPVARGLVVEGVK